MKRYAFLVPAAAAAALTLLLSVAPARAGNTAMLVIDVADPNGAPIDGATVVVSDPDLATFRLEGKTDARGRAGLAGLTPRSYVFRIEKEGYQGYESNFVARAGDTERKKVTLRILGAAPAGRPPEEEPAGAKVETKTLPWAAAFNEAVPLYSADKDEEALAKLDAALQLKSDYAPALALKGTIQEEHGRCDEAIGLLQQAYTLDPGRKEALGPLIRCLDKAGRSSEADGYRKLQSQVPRSKADLYNEAVTKINAGDDAAAGPLLEQALSADAKFAPAQYQYGLILFRRGDVAGAVERLTTYLKLDPSGEFAGDAKGLLAALKP